MMFPFEEQRLIARKKLLNSKDFLSFDKVPGFIINSFFGKCDYISRLIVVTFCVLNGLSPFQCFELCRFKDMSKVKLDKIISLYNYIKSEENRSRFYSYCVFYNKVLYINGDLRLNGKRIVNHNIFPRVCSNIFE